MKYVLSLLILMTVGCSQKPTTKSGFQLVLGQNLSASGGSFVNAIDSSKNSSTIYTLDSNNSATIVQGKYTILAIVFSGPEFKSGTPKCGYTEAVDLSAAEATVVINLNTSNCQNARYNDFLLKLKSNTTASWDTDQWDCSYWGP